MAKPHHLLLIASAALVLAAADAGEDFGWIPTGIPATCQGSIGKCMDDGAGEFEMDSEINRRMLVARRRYISYGALKPGSVPCSRRGASYYNCKPGVQANKYKRGCSKITKCR